MIVLGVFSALTILGALSWWLCWRSYSANDFFVFSAAFATLAFAVALVILACILFIAKPVSRHNCAKWGEKNERVTRFVEYNPYSWDCLAKTSDGHWLPTSQLRDLTP